MVFVTGDCHGVFHKFNMNNFPIQKELTKQDIVIICGDFGGIWDGKKDEQYWLDWLEEKSFTICFVDGNHENYTLLSTYPIVDFCGGKAHKIRENLYHLMRGYCFNFENQTFFAFGGASSHDIKDGILDPQSFSSIEEFKKEYSKLWYDFKQFRVKNVSWWEQELPSEEEMERGIKTLQEHNNKVDYVITHCLPQNVNAAAGFYDADKITNYFDKLIFNGLEFKHWYCGHYHVERRPMVNFDVLYDSIIRII